MTTKRKLRGGIWAAFVLLALGLPHLAFAQGAVLQSGTVTPGHGMSWLQNGIVTDQGPAAGGGVGVGQSEQNITARGTGSPPFAGQGTGPLGTISCNYDGPVTGANGYHYLCFSANAQGGGLIVYGAGGSAAQLPLSLVVNGVTTQLPFGTIASNSVLGNATATTATPTAQAMPSCSAAQQALIWTTNVGFGCASIGTSAAAGSLTGTTLASNVVSSSLTTFGTMASPTMTAPVINGVATGSGVATGNVNSTLVQRDGSGNFGANVVTASLTGNVTGNVTGNITGTAPAGTLTGTTLAANVVSSSLTGVGTIATGVWNGSPVQVTAGGTGVSTFTANAPLIGNGASNLTQGTRSGSTTTFATSTGSLTNGHCVSIDASGNFIDAGGACTTGGGGGTVSSGTANQLAYYNSTGTIVAGLASANNGVLVTGVSGVPSIATTLPSGLTIPTATLSGSFPVASLTGTTLPASVVTSSLTSTSTLTGGATGAGFTVALGTSTVTGVLGASHGGTGVANANTLTLADTTSLGVASSTVGTGTYYAGHSLIGVQTFCASGCTATGGAYTPDTGTNEIVVKEVGGGGGSGGCASTSSTQYCVAQSGSGASYAEVLLTSAFSGATVTIGTGGTAGTAGNNAGGIGVATTFGSAISCGGGNGGSGGAAITATTPTSVAGQISPAACTVSSGTTIITTQGGASEYGIQLGQLGQNRSGNGGASALGFGARGVGGNTAGVAGGLYGAGASAAAGNNGAATAGAAGGGGYMIVLEFN